jgi:putative flippase GtrA
MISLVKRLLKMRVIRYGLVGGVGIPINDLALLCFTFLLGNPHLGNPLFLLAEACAFEVSNIVNFVLNQFFTYSEQRQHIHGWEWVRRIAKGQLTSLSAMLLSILSALALIYFLHVNEYIANPAGIIIAFIYNFFVSNKLVFRPTAPSPVPAEIAEIEVISKVEATPK